LNKDYAASTVYLLDLFTPATPAPLLRSKFPIILKHLVPALTRSDAEAPLIRSSIGVLESLLLAQDAAGWNIPQADISPRRAVMGLLQLGIDERPKVRKRAQEALTKVLQNGPPGPSLEHPASDMCAASTLTSVQTLVTASEAQKKKGGDHDPRLIHSLQLVKAVATAGTWPSKRTEPLCELLLKIAKGGNEYLTMAALGVFEEVFAGLLEEVGGGKLDTVLDTIQELRPSHTDSQLLPPWLAVFARGYEVYAHVSPEVAFTKLPALIEPVATFLQSSAENIRTSAAQCIISLIENLIPDSALLDITRTTEKIFQQVAKIVTDLFSVRYQGAWMEVFDILNHLFEKLQWRASPVLNEAVKIIGELRSNDGFQGKKQADEVIGKAIHAMGPDAVLEILPLGLTKPIPGQAGRAWMIPILRDNIFNAKLNHFRQEMVPMSEAFFQKVVDFGEGEKTLEIKIFETLVGQIWDLLPSYCNLPQDLTEAFDQKFAELLANVLYQKVELRNNICRALQNLVDSNKAILETEPDEDGEEDLVAQHRITKEQAQKNLDHLASFAGNMLAVLFNVYSNTLPQFRGFILKCLNAFLSITPQKELMNTFNKVSGLLETSLAELTAQTQADKQKKKDPSGMPPTAHTLMDLVITITPYLPSDSYSTLFAIFNATVNKDTDQQLQKKAYKVIPRLAETEMGRAALTSQNEALQELLIASAATANAPCRRDRLVALATMIEFIPRTDLHFIPSILSEVVISAKEVNEKARTAAFDLLVSMGEKMGAGGIVVNRKVAHMPDDAPDAPATMEEYFTMVGAGLAGSNPHMVSASITALTRIMWQFKDQADPAVLADLVETLDIFLESKNREIVASVLGFIKVCAISLPKEMMEPRFKTLIPRLMVWSHEHKAHFKAKVKHIIERLVRRFGVEAIDRCTPEEDKKLIANIRKTRERRKRKKEEAKAAGDDSGSEDEVAPKRKNRFENEFDDALYGSESEEEGSGDEEKEQRPKRKGEKKGQQFIVEGEEDPLDLLDRKSLAHISTTRPQKAGGLKKKQTKAKYNEDGKLILGGDSDDERGGNQKEDEDMEIDMGGAGVDAYVEAVSGKNSYTRGQKGKVKFSNKRARQGDQEMDMDDDDEAPAKASGGGPKREFRKGGNGRGGFKKQMGGRKPLGQVRDGRAGKASTRGHGRR
jgi:ribosomal RNA-processing protein 12